MIAELSAQGPVSVAQIVSRLTPEGQGAEVTALAEFARTVSAKDEALEDCVRRLREQTRKRREVQLQEQIRLAQDAKQDATVQALLAEYQVMVTGGKS